MIIINVVIIMMIPWNSNNNNNVKLTVALGELPAKPVFPVIHLLLDIRNLTDSISISPFAQPYVIAARQRKCCCASNFATRAPIVGPKSWISWILVQV